MIIPREVGLAIQREEEVDLALGLVLRREVLGAHGVGHLWGPVEAWLHDLILVCHNKL